MFLDLNMQSYNLFLEIYYANSIILSWGDEKMMFAMFDIINSFVWHIKTRTKLVKPVNILCIFANETNLLLKVYLLIDI